MKIEVDGSRCEGYGFCEQSAPGLLAPDDGGVLHVLAAEAPDPQAGAAEAAVRVCPVAALPTAVAAA